MNEATFSDAALTTSRVVGTMRAVESGAFPTADTACESSSGTMRIVRSTQVGRMCWYANDYLRILRQVPQSQRIHDFIVCDRDCKEANMGVFALAKSRKILDERDRTVSVLPVNVGRHFQWVQYALRDRRAYDSKLPVAVWRGVSTSECWSSRSEAAAQRPACARRNLAIRWTWANSTKVDVGLSNVVQVSNHSAVELRTLLKEPMKVKKMLRYKYLISVEGNDVATNLKWALASTSVVFMPRPTRESFILESRLEPWVHYVPLDYNMHDLEAKVDYCENNNAHCRQISQTATEYMQAFTTRKKLFHLGAKVYAQHFKKLAL